MKGDPEPAARGRVRLEPVAWTLLFFLVAGLIQWIAEVPWDADTGYHVAVARMTAKHGILHAFPWTPFSWMADHYADKELLFHLFMVPFSSLPWMTTARLAGTVFGALVLVTLYRVLRAERVVWPGLWALLPLAGSSWFVMRYALVRPHVLAMSLSLIVAWAAGRRRWGVLFVAALLYPLCYTAWHTALALVLVVETAYLLSGRRPAWRTPVVTMAGLAAGLLLHPNFPEILRLSWIQTVDVLFVTSWTGKAGFELGTEFQPLEPGALLRFASLPFLFTSAALLPAWRSRRIDPLPLVFTLAALAFAVMTARTARFIEYLAPFAAAALALSLRDRPRGGRRAAALIAGSLVFTLLVGLKPIQDLAQRGDDIPPRFMAALERWVPPGAQVFTCEWGLTGELMLALPERRFLVALDPVFFWKKDPEKYRRWFETVHQGPPDAAEIVRREFGARHVICFNRPEWQRFFAALERDTAVRARLRSPYWYVYDLGDLALER